MDSNTYLSQLYEFIKRYFNLADLQDLCFKLNIDYESLAGDEKPSRIRSFIVMLAQNSRLPELTTLLRTERPAITWHDVPDDFVLPEAYRLGDMVEQLPPESGYSPYKGLINFTEDDADWFFGREALTTKLVNHLYKRDFLAIIGASGSGKSSVVQAGMIPIIKRKKTLPSVNQHFPGKWDVYLLKPTNWPLHELAATLYPKNDNKADELVKNMASSTTALSEHLVAENEDKQRKRLIVVDQFEELYTQSKDEEVQTAFIENLLNAIDANTKAIITLRADFYPQAIRNKRLEQELTTKGNQKVVNAMEDDEYKAAIENPAVKGNWPLQIGLVDTILADIGNEPGALPLLSHALSETWIRRRGRMLTLSGYQDACGVRGAISQTAERAYNKLTPTQQQAARRLFLRLTELGEDTQETRRRVSRIELGNDPVTESVIHELSQPDKRLIIADKDSVEVAHEAVIREWKTLQRWLQEDREGHIIHRRLTNATNLWHENDQDDSFLYSGLRLAEATAWQDENAESINPLETQFIQASVAEQTKQEEERKVQTRRVITILSVATVLTLLLATIASFFFFRANDNAQTANQNLATATSALIKAEQAGTQEAIALEEVVIESNARATSEAIAITRQAEAEQAGTQEAIALEEVVVESNARATSEAQALIAQEIAETNLIEAERQRRIAVVQSLASLSNIIFQQNNDAEQAMLLAIEAARLNWDNEERVSWLIDSTLRSQLNKPLFFNTTLHRQSSSLRAVAFSPDGNLLVTGGDDNLVRLWNLNNPGENPLVLSGHDDNVWTLMFSPDSRTLASGSVDNTIRLWDMDNPETAPIVLQGHEGIVFSVAFSPDGKILASGGTDNTVRLWDLNNPIAEPIVLLGHEDYISSVIFNPDGNVLASGSSDLTIRLWQLNDLEAKPDVLYTNSVNSLAFNPNGDVLASASFNQIRLWDMLNLRARSTLLSGHEEHVNSLAFSPDGNTLASGSSDQTVRLWDMNNIEAAPFIFRGHEAGVTSVYFSPDSKTVASVSGDVFSFDNTLQLLQIGNSIEEPTVMKGQESIPLSVAFSPDGTKLVSGSLDSTMRLWNLSNLDAKPELLTEFLTRFDQVVFSPDGNNLAIIDDNRVRLWDANNLENGSIVSWRLDEPVNSVAFSLDGKWLASGGEDQTVHLWNVNNLEADPIVLIGHEDEVNSIAFSSDGQLLASGSDDNSLRLWNIENLEMAPIVLRGHGAGVTSVAFSPDGNVLASGSRDDTLRLWNINNLEAESIVLNGHEDWVNSLAFSPNGSFLASGSSDETVRLWNINNLEAAPIVLEGHEERILSVAFSPDGQVLASASFDGTIRIWSTLEKMVEIGCTQFVRRNLTWEEWLRYLPNEPYRQTCPNLPPHFTVP